MLAVGAADYYYEFLPAKRMEGATHADPSDRDIELPIRWEGARSWRLP